jgi:hypothetical protein
MVIEHTGAGFVGISGNNATNIFAIGSGHVVTLRDITLRLGISAGACAAGITSEGTLTLENVTLLNNDATDVPGATSAICSSGAGTLTMFQSSASINYATAGGETINLSSGAHSITYSAIMENSGGVSGVVLQNGATIDITNTTIGVTDGGYVVSAQSGTTFNLLNDTLYLDDLNAQTPSANSLLQQIGTINAKNTLFSSTAGCDADIVDQGNNLDTGNECGLDAVTSIEFGDPKLGAPAGNLGGSTTVRPLLPGSEAIDAGGLAGCPPYDQRGVPPYTRPKDGNDDSVPVCDIGAFEADEDTTTASPTPSVTDSPTPSPTPSPTDTPTPTPTPASETPTDTPLGSDTATPTPTGSATATPSPTPTPTPTGSETPTPTPIPNPIQGDVDCDGDVDFDDFNLLITYAAGLNNGVTDAPNCVDLGDQEPITARPWGDLNCDGFVNALDALYLIAHKAGVALPQGQGCVAIGSVII